MDSNPVGRTRPRSVEGPSASALDYPSSTVLVRSGDGGAGTRTHGATATTPCGRWTPLRVVRDPPKTVGATPLQGRGPPDPGKGVRNTFRNAGVHGPQPPRAVKMEAILNNMRTKMIHVRLTPFTPE